MAKRNLQLEKIDSTTMTDGPAVERTYLATEEPITEGDEEDSFSEHEPIIRQPTEDEHINTKYNNTNTNNTNNANNNVNNIKNTNNTNTNTNNDKTKENAPPVSQPLTPPPQNTKKMSDIFTDANNTQQTTTKTTIKSESKTEPQLQKLHMKRKSSEQQRKDTLAKLMDPNRQVVFTGETFKRTDSTKSEINELNENKNNNENDEKIVESKDQILNLKSNITNYLCHCYGKLIQSKSEIVDKFENKPKKLNYHTFQKLLDKVDNVFSLRYSNDSSEIVSAHKAGALVIWNVKTGNKRLGIGLKTAWVNTCTFSPNNKFVASGGLDNICSIFMVADDQDKILGWGNSEPFMQFEKHEGYISCIRYIDNNRLITASGDKSMYLWDINRQIPITIFNGHSMDVLNVAINNHNRNYFISGSCDGTSKFWDIRVKNKKQKNNKNNNKYNDISDIEYDSSIYTFKGHESDVNATNWFPNGKSFISGSEDSSCRLYDISSQKQLSIYTRDDIFGAVKDVDFSKSGQYLFAAYEDDPYCLSWHTITGEECTKLQHTQTVSCLQVAPNGQSIATGSWDHCIRLWA